MKRVLSTALSIPLLFGTVNSVLAADQPRNVMSEDNSDQHEIYYEVFVRSFADSNNDGIGDLKGLTQKLDYINDGNVKTKDDLGATAIWLMPINSSPTYHKYNVTSHYDIDPEYGTMKDFERLIKKAHKRGVKVIMDLAVNHTSDLHPWFKDSMNKDSKYRDYYIWADENTDVTKKGPWGQQVWHQAPNGEYYYGVFESKLPDLNFDNPAVVEEMKKMGQFWAEKGVDGFRLDAAKHIYADSENQDDHEKNVSWWIDFEKAIREANPNAYLVGEVWDEKETVAPYYKGMNSLFNFDLSEKIVESVLNGENHDIAGSQSEMNELYKEISGRDPIDAVFLRNHDDTRIMSDFEGDTAKAKLSASILMTLSGNPFIYYGEEIGMKGDKPDEHIREPFVWSPNKTDEQTSWIESKYEEDGISVKEQNKDRNSLLNHYRKLTHLRQSNEVLMKGDIKPIDTNNSHILAFERSYNNKSNIVLHNLSEQSVRISLEDVDAKKIIYKTNKKVKMNKGRKQVNLTIPAQSSVILK